MGKIRDSVGNGNYDFTYHAADEMAEDNRSISDIEHAVFSGKIIKKEVDDLRGMKYVVQGTAENKVTTVGVVGRFKENGVFLIITVYEIT
jgi:hypothetical protein